MVKSEDGGVGLGPTKTEDGGWQGAGGFVLKCSFKAKLLGKGVIYFTLP